MPLADYRRKRRFDKTPEPSGAAASRRPRRGLQFVVQKHAARNLHYDFRLEHNGVLWSWAVPKGPSLDPNQKRLAVHVEDHPLEYAKFEGRIPAGQYGAGEVIVWDRGTWSPESDPVSDLKRGHLNFQLDGQKLSGGWRLIRMRGKEKEKQTGKENWLLVKRNDQAARPASEFDVAAELPESVQSGRALGSAVDEASNSKPSDRSSQRRASPRSTLTALLKPDDFPFALATLTDQPPAGKEWLHEIKFDGYRVLVFVSQDARGKKFVRIFTRNQLDWTSRYSTVSKSAARLPVASAVLDGELVALDDEGVSRFQLLQNSAGESEGRLVFFAFDLLHLDGEDLRPLPLKDRKARLAFLLGKDTTGTIRYSDHLSSQGPEFLRECCRRGLEGMISKRAGQPYHPGRTHDWLKIKCLGREELVIGGYADSTAASRSLRALLLGYFDDGQLIYAGRVGTGFDAATLRELAARLAGLQQKESPFAALPPRERVRGLHWVRPQVVAQIQFGSWTDDSILRHASFQGIREDKPARLVGLPESLAKRASSETPTMRKKPTAKAPRARKTKSQPASKPATTKAEQTVTLTHPERVLYADLDLTKQNLADYYAAMSEFLLPHVAGRPLSLLRCPEGVGQACFFQKHAASAPSRLRRVPIQEREGMTEYLVVDDAEGLAALAQISVLEIHPWGSRADNVERPDRLIFDLDPGPQVQWSDVVAAAKTVRDVLAKLELVSFVKTSGGKGLHVVVPLTGSAAWPSLKQFARAIAEHLAQEQPDRYTAKMAKAARNGRVFIDYLRNDRGATAVAAYSPRARAGAPVSLPVAWDELARLKSADAFTLTAARQRISRMKRDPWQEFFEVKQKLPKFARIA